MQNQNFKTVTKLSSIDAKSISEPIVSFDLFDTLLRRKYLAVNEVHDTVSAYLLARLGKARDLAPGQLTLTRYNTGNFLKTSPHVAMEEPNLHVIWQRIISTLEINKIENPDRIVNDVIDFEFDLEVENLVLVEGAHDLLRQLKHQNKTIIAVSDMYFSKRQIEAILDKLKILPFFEKVYVSVDAGATKQTGRLFQHVLNDLHIKPKAVHHIGDNAHSDILMGSKAGLAVTRIDQPDKLHLERPAYGRRSDIHTEIADLTKSFLFKILFGAINNKTDHIYFMSRDGLLLRRVFERWRSPFIERYFNSFDQSDLFLSRATSCWLALNFRGEWLTQAVGFAFWLCHGTATVRQISDLFGIEDIPLDQGDRVFSSSSDTALVVRAYERAQLSDKVYESLMAKRRLAEEYLSEAKLFSARHVTLCDIGYSGTVARDLNSFFLQESLRSEAPRAPKVELELLSTNANYNSNAPLAQPYIRFGGISILPSDKLPQSLIDSFAWLEVFFKHPSFGPLKGYAKKGGRAVPDYDTDTDPTGNYPCEKIVDSSAFKSEDIVLLWMSSIAFWDQLTDPLIARFAAPDLNIVGQMDVAIYEDDAVTNRKRSIILNRPDLSATEIYNLAKVNDYWIPGSILASATAGTASAEQFISNTQNVPSEETTAPQPVDKKNRTLLPKKFRVGNLKNVIARNFRFARSKLDRSKLDARFYQSYYPDLAAFDEESLKQHFIEHGRGEGRFAEASSLIEHLEKEYGPLPKDFDSTIYRNLHSDLPFDEEWQLKAHYLQFGRNERRRYDSGLGIDEQEFQDLMKSGLIELTSAEQTAHLGGASIRKILFERANIEAGSWLNLFDYSEFQALNYHWAGQLQSRAHALAVFLDRGPAHLASLSLNGRFDYGYYTRIHSKLKDTPPEHAYRFWLQHGAGAGEAASEDDRLFQLIGERAYPDAFKYDLFADRYQGAGEAVVAPDRVDLLALFLQGGFTSDTDLVQGPRASRIWEIVARNARRRGQLDEAIRAYENALKADGPVGRILHQLGDIYTNQHRLHDALHCYERCVDATNPDRWSFVNGARLAADLGYFEKSLSFISRGKNIWAEKEPWRRARDHAYSTILARSAIESERVDGPANPPPTLDYITNLISSEFNETRSLSNAAGFVLIVCESQINALPQREIEQARAYVQRELGPNVKILALDHSNVDSLVFVGAACVVFHELRSTPQTIRLALGARALSLPTAYWIGSLDGSDASELHDENTAARLVSLLTSDLAFHFMSLCDYGLATLPTAVDVLRRSTRKQQAALIGRVGSIARYELHGSRSIFFVDFSHLEGGDRSASSAWSIIDRLLSERDHISIAYDQASTPPRHLIKFSERLNPIDLRALNSMTNWIVSGFEGQISFGTSHIGVLVDAIISNREAALLGIPNHVFDNTSPSANGGNRAASESLEKLLNFVDATVSRKRDRVRNGSATRDFFRPISALQPAAVDGFNKSKRRVLFANVFFAPQTIGGATRVLKDNIDYILDHHADEFEIAVLTSDDENDLNGSTRVDGYRGVPVVRIATPQELDMDWRPFNAEVYQHTLTVLENFKPDLVHIHCLQRLSVAVADACRAAKIPYIVTLHDAWWLSDYSFLINDNGELAMPSSDVLAQKFSKRIGLSKSLARAAQLRSALAAAETRLAVSQSFGEIYKSCGFEVKVVANGVSRLNTRPRVAAGQPVRLAHVGGTQHHKGMFLIESALRLGNFKNLAFSYVDLFRDPGDVSQLVWGTTPVTVHGKIPAGAIEEIYAQTDVLIAPSIWPESFGLVAREALSAGCWVIAGNLGAMGDEITQGENGFVIDTAQPDSLSRILREIDNNPARFKQSPHLKMNLRKADDQSKELVGFYRDIMN